MNPSVLDSTTQWLKCWAVITDNPTTTQNLDKFNLIMANRIIVQIVKFDSFTGSYIFVKFC